MTADRPQSMLSHLEELRWRLVKIAIAVVAAGAVAVIFTDQITEILEGPFDRAAPDSTLQTLAVGEQWGVLIRIGLFGHHRGQSRGSLPDLGLRQRGVDLQVEKVGDTDRHCAGGPLCGRGGVRVLGAAPGTRVSPQNLPRSRSRSPDRPVLLVHSPVPACLRSRVPIPGIRRVNDRLTENVASPVTGGHGCAGTEFTLQGFAPSPIQAESAILSRQMTRRRSV